MEIVELGQPFTVIVDYAHTPGAFERLFPWVRKTVPGRITAVFGSAGERDRAKRPMQGDAAARYADIKFIFSHAGGTMTSLIERFGVGAPDTINDNLAGAAAPNSRLYHLRRFYYDTAQSVNVVQMRGLKTIAGVGQIVFGTDYPFQTAARTLRGLDKCGFSASELQAIQRGTAAKLLPRFS